MIRIENTEVIGWRPSIRGMRNPMNSWNKSDSNFSSDCSRFVLGKNDKILMQNLCQGGSEHRKFMRMIQAYCDITAPLYWWKEFDTYKVGTVANSCSTMHKIHAKEFTRNDFSWEHLYGDYAKLLDDTIDVLNFARKLFIETKEKDYWWQIIQLLPSSYNQKRTIMMNYEVLSNIYQQRKNHKLDEWHVLCAWIELLPHSDLITGKEV